MDYIRGLFGQCPVGPVDFSKLSISPENTFDHSSLEENELAASFAIEKQEKSDPYEIYEHVRAYLEASQQLLSITKSITVQFDEMRKQIKLCIKQTDLEKGYSLREIDEAATKIAFKKIITEKKETPLKLYYERGQIFEKEKSGFYDSCSIETCGLELLKKVHCLAEKHRIVLQGHHAEIDFFNEADSSCLPYQLLNIMQPVSLTLRSWGKDVLPDLFSGLFLEKLTITDDSMLTTLPPSLHYARNLKELDLSGCPLFTDFSSLPLPPSLRTLRLDTEHLAAFIDATHLESHIASKFFSDEKELYACLQENMPSFLNERIKIFQKQNVTIRVNRFEVPKKLFSEIIKKYAMPL